MSQSKLTMKKLFLHTLQYTFLAGFLFFGISSGYAQNDLKSWNSLQLDISLTKKLDLRLGHLEAFNINDNFSRDFNQSSARLDYDVTKRISLAAGVVLGSLSAADDANRVTLRGTYKIPIADVLSWSNSLQGEVHSVTENRYRYRILYITRLATRRRLDFLRLSPSISYTLFYNIGGKPIQYFDNDDDPAVLQTPDGFHRGRLSFNLNAKINKNISFTMYYMMQREFNFLTADYHKMNITDPNTEKIVRPFRDFNVIGTTFSVNFDLYKKKQKSKKIRNPGN